MASTCNCKQTETDIYRLIRTVTDSNGQKQTTSLQNVVSLQWKSDETLFLRSLTYCHPALIFFNLRSIPGSYHRTLGWTGCGYHYVIPIEGTIEPARPEDITGAHCRSHNSHSIGICYISGLQPTAAPLRTHARKPRRVPFVICWSPFTEAIRKR